MERLRHGQTCASSLCDKDRRTDDVESNMIDKVINKSSILMYALGREEVIRFLKSIAGLRRRRAT